LPPSNPPSRIIYPININDDSASYKGRPAYAANLENDYYGSPGDLSYNFNADGNTRGQTQLWGFTPFKEKDPNYEQYMAHKYDHEGESDNNNARNAELHP